MKPKTQWIIAGVLGVGIVIIAALVASGGSLPPWVPGGQNMAEVTCRVERSWWGGIGLTIPEQPKIYYGLPLSGIGPFFFEGTYRVTVTASVGTRVVGSSSATIGTSWGSTNFVTIKVPLENYAHNIEIEAKLIEIPGGQVVSSDRVVIV